LRRERWASLAVPAIGAGLLEECIMQKSHYLDYDPVALAVLFLGLGMVGLFVFIWKSLVWRKIMSKTNDASKLASRDVELANQARELTEAELNHVSGGKLLETAVKGQVYKRVEIHGTW
jgi:bacteriocin-like protein